MESNQKTYNSSSDEISLRDIILKIKDFIKYFWSKKIFIIIPFILIVAFFIYQAKTAPWIYKGETKFFLEGGSGGGSGLGGLLGQIGGKKTNPFQVIEVAESKIQMTEVLFEKVGPDSNYLANIILDVYDLPTIWSEDNEEYIGFSFKHNDIEKFSALEKLVLLKLIRKVVDNSNGDALVTTKFDEDKGYYQLSVKSLSHDLTLNLSHVSYEKLKIYFEDKTREKLRITRDILKVKSDSIKSLLDNKISLLANFKDKNRDLIYNIDQVKEVVLQSEITGLNTAFMEILKSYEMADYKYMDQKNYFMLIDKPRAPLGLIFANWKVEAIKGGILALLLSFGFLFIFKIYNDIMES